MKSGLTPSESLSAAFSAAVAKLPDSKETETDCIKVDTSTECFVSLGGARSFKEIHPWENALLFRGFRELYGKIFSLGLMKDVKFPQVD